MNQGVFGSRGYRDGRAAATLSRLNVTPENPSAAATVVGFAPYELQQINTPDQHGKITVLHCPTSVPVLEKAFQLVRRHPSRTHTHALFSLFSLSLSHTHTHTLSLSRAQ